MGKVTDEMLDAGLKAYYGVEPSSIPSGTKRDCSSDMARAYVAMRAARPRKGRAQKPVVDRDAVAEAIRQAYYTKANSILSVDWAVLADAAIAAMGAELSEELAALRARCERLAALARTLNTPQQWASAAAARSGVTFTPMAAADVAAAMAALHPGDTEEAK